jgi:hypothetical protein
VVCPQRNVVIVNTRWKSECEDNCASALEISAEHNHNQGSGNK